MLLISRKSIKSIFALAVSIATVSTLWNRDSSIARTPSSAALDCSSLFSDSTPSDKLMEIRTALASRQRWIDESLMVSSDFAETKLYWYPSPNPTRYFEGIDRNANAIVLALGGAGLKTSSGGNWAEIGRRFMSAGVSFVSYDYPFHVGGSRDAKYQNLNEVVSQAIQIIKFLKRSGKPVILLGMSFGPVLIQEIVGTSPSLVQGAIYVSPGGALTEKMLAHYKVLERNL